MRRTCYLLLLYAVLITVFARCAKKNDIDLIPQVAYRLEYALSSTTYPALLSLKVYPDTFQKIEWVINGISVISVTDTLSKLFTKAGPINVTCKIVANGNIIQTISRDIMITNYEILDSVVILKYSTIYDRFTTEGTGYNFKSKSVITVKNANLLLNDLSQIPNLDKDNVDDIALYHAIQTDGIAGLGHANEQPLTNPNWKNLKGYLDLNLNLPIFLDKSPAKRNNPLAPNKYYGIQYYNGLMPACGSLLHEMGHDFTHYFDFTIDKNDSLSLIKNTSTIHFNQIIAKKKDVVDYTTWVGKGNYPGSQGYPFDIMHYVNEYGPSIYNSMTLWKMGYLTSDEFDKLEVKYSPVSNSSLTGNYKIYGITSKALADVTTAPTDAQRNRRTKVVLPVILYFEEDYTRQEVLQVRESLKAVQSAFPDYYKNATMGKAIAYIKFPVKK